MNLVAFYSPSLFITGYRDMAKQQTLGGRGLFYVGEDKSIVMEVLANAADTPVDVSGWTTALVISRSVVGDPLLTKSGTVGGSYNATRASNTQRVTFTLADTETDALTAGTYHFSVKRTDAGSEVVLAEGPCLIEQTNQ